MTHGIQRLHSSRGSRPQVRSARLYWREARELCRLTTDPLLLPFHGTGMSRPLPCLVRRHGAERRPVAIEVEPSGWACPSAEEPSRMTGARDPAGVARVERRRLARELHDRAGSGLTLIGLQIARLQREVGALPADRLAAELATLKTRIEALGTGLRETVDDLAGPEVTEAGLGQAVRDWVADWARETDGPTLILHWEPEAAASLPPGAAEHVLRIVQEALSNVARHAAKARSVRLLATAGTRAFHLAIADDGPGLPARRIGERPGHGLAHLRERAALIGGRLRIVGQPGAGVGLFLSVPGAPSRTP